jgi:hypothetical protein
MRYLLGPVEGYFAAATDPAEIDNLLLEFRDALHEHIEQRTAEAKKLERMVS